jgi:hypothetical protein
VHVASNELAKRCSRWWPCWCGHDRARGLFDTGLLWVRQGFDRDAADAMLAGIWSELSRRHGQDEQCSSEALPHLLDIEAVARQLGVSVRRASRWTHATASKRRPVRLQNAGDAHVVGTESLVQDQEDRLDGLAVDPRSAVLRRARGEGHSWRQPTIPGPGRRPGTTGAWLVPSGPDPSASGS